jgi:hypothetical protein
LKLKDAIRILGQVNAQSTAIRIAQDLDIPWEKGVSVVFNAINTDPDRVPKNISGGNDNKESAIRKWLLKYKSGKAGRASQRISNIPGTVADPIIEKIIGAKIAKLSSKDLRKITDAHRLSMSAENILGLILEEYLVENIKQYGWHCAWGETVKSVDFVHEDGRLLQIKNRSNSENSSSSSIRDGTQIERWFRIKANRVEYMWTSLNSICGTTCLSEESFIDFVKMILSDNPACLAVEPENLWDQ